MPNPQNKIIKIASELFLSNGFKSVTTDNISCHMQMSKKTLYSYFSKKEDLVWQTLLFLDSKINQEIEKILDLQLNPIEEIFQIKKKIHGIFAESMERNCFVELGKYYPKLYKKINLQRRDHIQKVMGTNLIRGMEMDLFRKNLETEKITLLYFQTLIGINEHSLENTKKEDQELLYCELFVRGIATPKGTKVLEELLLKNNPQTKIQEENNKVEKNQIE